MQQRERERQRQTDTHTHMLVLRMQEMREIVGDDLPFAFQNLSLDLPEYQGTPEDVAIEKCRAAFQQVHNSSHSLLLSPPLSSSLLHTHTLVTGLCERTGCNGKKRQQTKQ